MLCIAIYFILLAARSSYRNQLYLSVVASYSKTTLGMATVTPMQQESAGQLFEGKYVKSKPEFKSVDFLHSVYIKFVIQFLYIRSLLNLLSGTLSETHKMIYHHD